MDKIKSFAVPKLMKLLGPDAEDIANAVKQAAGGDLTANKENAIKVVKALGINKDAAKDKSPEMAEGIAGNWQGKLNQALYTLGLLGSAGAAAAMWGTVGGSSMAVIGTILLMFANTFFGDAPGQVGAMGKFGNKGTSTRTGKDDFGRLTTNSNVR
jgi:TRAP-type mannitol/chloroaromatic compound transport system substrate-binding protein